MTRRSGAILLILAFLPVFLQAASPEISTKPVSWKLDQSLCEPETVIPLNLSGHPDPVLTVSNVCGFMRNGKGYLSLVSQKGEMLTASWVSKLNAPAGMAVHDGKLYVVDINVIHVIDLQNATIEGAEVARVLRLTPQPRALNDIAISKDGQIFVSDSARHQVLRVEEGVTSSLAPLPFQNANGLHFQDDTLFVGGKQLWRVSLSGGTIKDITPRGLTDIDGIQSDGKGGLMISVVGGPVWHLPLAGPATRWTAEGVSSANMGYLPKRQLAIIPTGFDNSLIAFRVP